MKKVNNMSKTTLKDQVEFVLKNAPETRNDDVHLTIGVWVAYYKFFLEGDRLPLMNLKKLPREDHVKRIRATIQNKEKRLLPTDPAVAKRRGWAEADWRRELGYAPKVEQTALSHVDPSKGGVK